MTELTIRRLYLVIKERFRVFQVLSLVHMPVGKGDFQKKMKFNEMHTYFLCPFSHGVAMQQLITTSGIEINLIFQGRDILYFLRNKHENPRYKL